ncbi:MAG TPA: FAD-binding oxidoreductase [Burkholderiales bacterium]|nr:FAD-binding oxidoreductase [Burkholderiales bacterium]
MSGYEERRTALARAIASGGASIGLRKDSSNLFRDRSGRRKRRLDVRGFNHVLRVDRDRGWVDAEGMITYEDLVTATLTCGSMPAVVPQLKTITLGGAVAGVGIEATSFRHGLVHETVLELEVLLADGSIVLATPDNEHRDLFFGFANSYGTLGYALRVRARTIPVKRFVMVERHAYQEAGRFFLDLESQCHGDADFVDGVVFAPDELYLNLGYFADRAPATSDYGLEHIYYRSIRDKPLDYLTTHDYIWRWDSDWFWCSKNLGAQHPLLRKLYGRAGLNSRTYTRLMRWNSRLGLTRALDRVRGLHPEPVIQDVDIPVSRAAEFLEFLHQRIGILPIWICPVRPRPDYGFSLFPMIPGALHVNFGFWDTVRTRERYSAGHFNRLVERKVQELGGIKSLYSDSYFPEEEFWNAYGWAAYERLKGRYDPERRLGNLYQKCVLRR